MEVHEETYILLILNIVFGRVCNLAITTFGEDINGNEPFVDFMPLMTNSERSGSLNMGKDAMT